MSGIKAKIEGAIVWSVMLGGVMAEGYVLYFVNDPALRIRIGMFLLAPIVIPLLWAPHRFPVFGLPQARPRRRFTQLRKWVRELLREISRLNWLAVDTDRGYDDREEKKAEIEGIESRLLQIIEEIKTAAGKVDQQPEEGHKADIALRKDPSPRWSPDQPQEGEA
ncbi:MAG: hypothetical protein O7I93_16295 [Gemmatimonadetes bacterium]|nr:hypothetical protein [Gemmatimonadota bacterium]